MIHWVRHVRRGILGLATAGRNLLLPPHCTNCNRELSGTNRDEFFCLDCLARLGPPTWFGCGRCGGEVIDVGFTPRCCPLCRDMPLKFDATVTLGSYHAGLRDVVLRMKRPMHTALSVAMGELLVRRRGEQLLDHRADVIVPIPMFWARRLYRGINSPEILARCLASSLGIPVRRNLLVRCRNTLPQANLPPSRRFKNVRGAFRVRHPNAVQDARVLLVDDVLTTGATCSEAANMLKRAGAATVLVAVIARAQGR